MNNLSFSNPQSERGGTAQLDVNNVTNRNGQREQWSNQEAPSCSAGYSDQRSQQGRINSPHVKRIITDCNSGCRKPSLPHTGLTNNSAEDDSFGRSSVVRNQEAFGTHPVPGHQFLRSDNMRGAAVSRDQYQHRRGHSEKQRGPSMVKTNASLNRHHGGGGSPGTTTRSQQRGYSQDSADINYSRSPAYHPSDVQSSYSPASSSTSSISRANKITATEHPPRKTTPPNNGSAPEEIRPEIRSAGQLGRDGDGSHGHRRVHPPVGPHYKPEGAGSSAEMRHGQTLSSHHHNCSPSCGNQHDSCCSSGNRVERLQSTTAGPVRERPNNLLEPARSDDVSVPHQHNHAAGRSGSSNCRRHANSEDNDPTTAIKIASSSLASGGPLKEKVFAGSKNGRDNGSEAYDMIATDYGSSTTNEPLLAHHGGVPRNGGRDPKIIGTVLDKSSNGDSGLDGVIHGQGGKGGSFSVAMENDGFFHHEHVFFCFFFGI